MAIIELKNITKSYWIDNEELKILKGISLEVKEGEFVAIMGPSGSGKSTLMQIMGLLDRPTSGTFHLLGLNVSELSDDEGAAIRSKTIGFIFQMFNLLSRTSAIDNVMLPMIYSGAHDRQSRSRELLNMVGLSDRIDHKPNELSGGQQQRVAIARALVNKPRIIFADEPTGNLASDQSEEILQKLKDLNNSGITIIMVTHEPDIAAHAKRIFHLKDGIIVSDELTANAGKSGKDNIKASLEKSSFARPSEKPSETSLGVKLAQFKEYGASALRAMASNKVRSALSMLGILIGVAAVIAMLAVGKGAQKAIEARLASLGSNLLMMRPAHGHFGGVGAGGGSVSRLRLEDVKAISGIPHVKHVEGNVQGNAQVVYGDKNTNTRVLGAPAVYEKMHNAAPYYGRFFTDEENLELTRVALLGQTVVTNLFGRENPVDATIKVNHINFKVIGILPMKGSTGFNDQDDMILIPLNTAMKRVLGMVYLQSINTECDGPDSIQQVMTDMTALMRRRHHLPDYKDDDFDIRNMADIQAALSGTTQTFTLLLGIVAAISLLVGGIGIMNIMLVSVSERTREIGLRKAVGAPRRAILIQFLIESAVLSTLGGIIGIILGTSVSLILSKFAGWAAIVTPQAVILAFTFSATVGIIFGFWPARKASLLSPIEALRYE
ncbi:MAG: ABC transporter permease [Elusimicrobia bacterium]|nr:ABC transporter permease [Candidatus Liberimonas magnetica]